MFKKNNSFTEPIALSWLHLRRNRCLNIEESFITISQLKISLLNLRDIQEIAPWYLPQKWGSLTITYYASHSKTLSTVTILLSKDEVTSARSEIAAAAISITQKFARKLQTQVLQLKQRYLLAYPVQRYARFSSAQRFASTERDECNTLISRLRGIVKLPYLHSDTLLEELHSATTSVAKIQKSTIDFAQHRTAHNDGYLAHFEVAEPQYFQTVENEALTPEQVQAAMVFEDLTHVTAAAGSGKSSSIVGKIGFALKLGIPDHEILALAYNKAAAKGLEERLKKKLGKVLERDVTITSKTFHGFGRSILIDHYGDGYAPKLLKEEGKEENRHLKSVIDTLFTRNPEFREALIEWVALSPYELPNLMGTGEDIEECERRYQECCRERIQARDQGRFSPSIPTYRDDLYVRSLEERSIVNWLLIRGVEFHYEKWDQDGAARLGLGKTVNGKDKPYKPDFTYLIQASEDAPSIEIIHEHFALGSDGKAPTWMGGDKYVAQAKQKRAMHQERMKERTLKNKKRRFFETRSSQFKDGTIWQHLESELRKNGIAIGAPQNEIKDKALKGFRESPEFEALLIDFVLRFKDSGLTQEEVHAKAQRSANAYRAQTFLTAAFMVFDSYQAYLKREEKIDYSDMIRDAVQILKNHPNPLPYKLVLVDEFQDISKLRADLVNAVLKKNPEESMLFCVGDDWQTINRFSGSDVKIFTNTADHFQRHSKQLKLSKTFRCSQSIANTSRALVMRNPGQSDKDVVANTASKFATGVRIRMHEPSGQDRYQALLDELYRLIKISSEIGLKIPSVQILVRTKKTAPKGVDPEVLEEIAIKFRGQLDITWNSVHGSKGLEADFVVIPGLDSGKRGFPEDRPPEPLFDLILPEISDPVEEERRLLYVGLTRARHQAVLLADAERPSPFLFELKSVSQGTADIEWVESETKRTACPRCTIGSLHKPYEKANFRACSRSYSCGHREHKKK